MTGESANEDKPSTPGRHIELVTDDSKDDKNGENGAEPSPALTNGKGWDGKLRIPGRVSLANPEALSDPDYSDDENVVKGDEIEPDEGKLPSPTCQVISIPSLIGYSNTDGSLFADLFDDEDPDTDELISINSRIQSIPSLRLERFKKVARLCLRQNGITHIEGLEPLADTLQDLDFYDNLIGHIRGLDQLTKLTSLDLSFNKIKHIKHVNHLTELTDLYFVANKISTIENLEGLNKLRMLELASNRIREIQNLDSLKNLEELWLAKNKITSLTGLSELPKLKLLSIQSNRIRDVSPLKDVPSLEELYMSHNALESLAGLETNTKLRVLEISHNPVRSLEGVGPLIELEEVWASYSHLSDFNDVEKNLKDKAHLETVYFEGTPLQLRAPALYRNKVRLALPNIRQIDASKSRRSPRRDLIEVDTNNFQSFCQNRVNHAVDSSKSRFEENQERQRLCFAGVLPTDAPFFKVLADDTPQRLLNSRMRLVSEQDARGYQQGEVNWHRAC